MMPSPEGIAIILACSKLDICCMTLLPGADDEKLFSFIHAEGVRFAFIEEVFLNALFGIKHSVQALETVFAMPHDAMIAAAKLLVSSQQNMKPGMIMHSRIPMFTAAGNSMETMSPFAGGMSIATGQIPMADGQCIPEEFKKFAPNCFMIAKTSILQAMDNPLMSSLDFSQLVSFYNIGESLSEEEKSRIGDFFVSRGAQTTIRNAYGLSESNCILTAELPSLEPSSTVGHPVPGVTLRIVDPDTLGDVETGKPGEIVYSAPLPVLTMLVWPPMRIMYISTILVQRPTGLILRL